MKINNKIILLIISDMLILSSFGLIAPIFALFIEKDISGGSIVSAGLATTIFFVVKSSVQLPLSRYIDKQSHKTNLLIFGTFLIVCVPFIYLLAESVSTIFLAQAIYGLGAAFAYPTFFSLFTKYIDKKHKGFEYSLWSTGTGIGIALTAFLGAKIADLYGFRPLFLIVGFFALSGFLLLFFLDKQHNRSLKK